MQVLFVIGMTPVIVAAFARTRFAVDTDRRGVAYAISNGILATAGMVCFYVAMGRGKASVVGPITALFPLFTVGGAVILLGERLNPVQMLGIVFAIAALLVFA
jgi:drug/metabolite transporter (DMT)-like permease